MWSDALSDVGGCGRALNVPVVAVLKVEIALGEGGSGELMGGGGVCILAVPGVSITLGTGLRLGGSEFGTGRRLIIEGAADTDSVVTCGFGTGVEVNEGSGGGGEGGGECWYVVALL